MIAAEIFALYERCGTSAYFGEPVSVSEHSLQAAHFARAARAPDALVIAALLHDIGHLLEAVPQDIAAWTRDVRHELTGARWLAARFGPSVAEPVRLHVPAKRYLCATDPHYTGRLSAASVQTLALQGGPMSAAEVAAFETEPRWREAVQLRYWDDRGKIAGLQTEGFADYRGMIEQLAQPAGTRAPAG